MIYADNIIEWNNLTLRNLSVHADNTEADVWQGPYTGYGPYTVRYETALSPEHYYYQRCSYKFTTTDQSPTWVMIYIQGGSATNAGTYLRNPVAGTEYVMSGMTKPIAYYGTSAGTLYNGSSGYINGVQAYIKNHLTYDVTYLYMVLKALGVVSTDAQMKAWCDENLDYVPIYTDYDVSALVQQEAENKIALSGGVMMANEFIEADGMAAYDVYHSYTNNAYYDLGRCHHSLYNNSSGGAVSAQVIEDETGPFYPLHKNVLKVTTNGTASPSAGGIWLSHTAYASAIFIERMVAKIPVGYRIYAAYNTQGSGASVQWITKQDGTGDWEEYAVLYRCGASGSFSSGGHIYISGPNNTNVTWYVAYARNCDITGHEELINYSVLGNCDRLKGGNAYSRQFDTVSPLIISNTNMPVPSGWEIDYEDYAGDAKWSLVQPVGATHGYDGPTFPVNPNIRYRISYWVKCKRDMASFLTAMLYYTSAGKNITHVDVMYYSGTRTYLTAPLTAGDTSMKVRSVGSWAAKSSSALGFRTAYSSYNNVGFFHSNWNTVAGVDGTDTVLLNAAYSGTTIPASTYVVESYAGSTYWYPIGKNSLPTDNEWHYVEGYLGRADTPFDGSNAYGIWGGIPLDTKTVKLALNIYTNNGTVPIKFSDIKIVPVGGTDPTREYGRIQIAGGV